MAARKYHLHGGHTGAALAVRVTPRAARNEIVEIRNDGTVRIRLTAPPVEGKANEALIEFLAELLGVAKSRLEIVAGHKGRDKLVTVLDLDAETVQKRLVAHLA